MLFSNIVLVTKPFEAPSLQSSPPPLLPAELFIILELLTIRSTPSLNIIPPPFTLAVLLITVTLYREPSAPVHVIAPPFPPAVG